MSRRFLHLLQKCPSTMYSAKYSLHRLDTSPLFYKTAAAAAAASADKKLYKKELMKIWRLPEFPNLPLPASSINFESCTLSKYDVVKGDNGFFAPLRRTKVAWVDCVGQTAIYDTRTHISQIMPKTNSFKGLINLDLCIPNTEVSYPDSESLYILDMQGQYSVPFEVLSLTPKGWLWNPLPPPPFFSQPEYQQSWGLKGFESPTAVQGNNILVTPSTGSGQRIGTYSFNMVTQQWLKAGEMPLASLKADYDSELCHWFGFTSDSPNHFCAISSLYPPKVQRVWADIDPPKNWVLLDQLLVNLGSGRFCIAKKFRFHETRYDEDIYLTRYVFLGVEVVRCIDEPGGLKMIKHKFKCTSRRIELVF